MLLLPSTNLTLLSPGNFIPLKLTSLLKQLIFSSNTFKNQKQHVGFPPLIQASPHLKIPNWFLLAGQSYTQQNASTIYHWHFFFSSITTSKKELLWLSVAASHLFIGWSLQSSQTAQVFGRMTLIRNYFHLSIFKTSTYGKKQLLQGYSLKKKPKHWSTSMGILLNKLSLLKLQACASMCGKKNIPQK